jgi:hypothetical protein
LLNDIEGENAAGGSIPTPGSQALGELAYQINRWWIHSTAPSAGFHPPAAEGKPDETTG